MPAKKSTELTASHWMMRAERARQVAGYIPDPRIQQLMLQIADDYEKLAERCAGAVQNNPKVY